MKIIGLTGGIGSGKTTVAEMFRNLGIPVYIADIEAKKLTNTSKVIRKRLIALLGTKAYTNEELDRAYVASIIFNDPKILQQVNSIIHPKVAAHFKRWVKRQEGPYCIKEAAILFENEGYKQCDLTILVIAPRETRIQRILQRDTASAEQIEQRMANQWSDEKKIPLADFVIENTDLSATQAQVKQIHERLINTREK
ncbi:dephospho-CoA kinase [Altibacter sp.]|uniref:dephospho-CoA kinase n=1 Tax=Altibacter sp. TaxID=2024823 RepID=UPI000C91F9DE|nr:dephospho-CoA kinase [Altibacter sp.]MAP54367.1 dephospho-CoA kinase [Altibacter sp.]